jgi:hypothetical protein
MVMYKEERDEKGAGADATWFSLTLFNLFFTTHRYSVATISLARTSRPGETHYK